MTRKKKNGGPQNEIKNKAACYVFICVKADTNACVFIYTHVQTCINALLVSMHVSTYAQVYMHACLLLCVHASVDKHHF